MKMRLNLLSPPLAYELLVAFLACPRKVTQRRAPGGNALRHAWSSSVHFGNSLHSRIALINAGHRLANLLAQTVRNASPSDSVAWLNFRMGTMARSSDSNLYLLCLLRPVFHERLLQCIHVCLRLRTFLCWSRLLLLSWLMR